MIRPLAPASMRPNEDTLTGRRAIVTLQRTQSGQPRRIIIEYI